MNEKLDRIKAHFKRHEVLYASIGTGIVIATITTLIMRESHAVLQTGANSVDELSERISRANGVTAGRDIVVTKKSVLNSVSYFSADRQGPPSWVVHCKETGNVFTSQRAAALGMELSESHVSSHLNGNRSNVNGYTFERICMAA